MAAEQHLANGAREMALDWLEERIDAYKAVQESGLLDEGGGLTSARAADCHAGLRVLQRLG